jgi:hypothetical protein
VEYGTTCLLDRRRTGDRRTGVDVLEAVLRALGHGHDVAREEGIDGRPQFLELHAGQLHAPHRGVDAVGQRTGPLRGLDAFQDRHLVGQRGVERRPDRLWLAGDRQADLQVLGLAGRPGRRRPEVGDLRVRAEAGGERHRHARAAQRPLQGAGEVAVAREPEPAPLGVADAQLLDGRWRGRAVGLAGHQTTVSGSRLRPVGPIWISVPMVGQTPQS